MLGYGVGDDVYRGDINISHSSFNDGLGRYDIHLQDIADHNENLHLSLGWLLRCAISIRWDKLLPTLYESLRHQHAHRYLNESEAMIVSSSNRFS